MLRYGSCNVLCRSTEDVARASKYAQTAYRRETIPFKYALRAPRVADVASPETIGCVVVFFLGGGQKKNTPPPNACFFGAHPQKKPPHPHDCRVSGKTSAIPYCMLVDMCGESEYSLYIA
jgi:hypothetical protein